MSEEQKAKPAGVEVGPNDIIVKCPECGQNEKFLITMNEAAENHYMFRALCVCGYMPDNIVTIDSYNDNLTQDLIYASVSNWDWAIQRKDKEEDPYPFNFKSPRLAAANVCASDAHSVVTEDQKQVDFLFKKGAEISLQENMSALLALFKQFRITAHVSDFLKAKIAYNKFKVIKTDMFFEGPLNIPTLISPLTASTFSEGEIVFGAGQQYDGIDMSVFWQHEGQRELINELVHAFTGIISEVGELMDATLIPALRGKEMDLDNAMEEDGDLLFYLQTIRQNMGFSLVDSLKARINKLKKRYPVGYNDKAATERADKQEVEK